MYKQTNIQELLKLVRAEQIKISVMVLILAHNFKMLYKEFLAITNLGTFTDFNQMHAGLLSHVINSLLCETL